jgi:hypothetical protein
MRASYYILIKLTNSSITVIAYDFFEYIYVKALLRDIDCQGATREGASPPSLLGGLPLWLGRTYYSGPCPASPRGLSILLKKENAYIIKRGPKD